MRTRDTSLILVGLGAMAVMAYLVFGSAGQVAASPSGLEDPVATESVVDTDKLPAKPGGVETGHIILPNAPPEVEGPDTTGWTNGRIVGDIRLDPRCIEDIQTLTVECVEAVAAEDLHSAELTPWREVRPLKWSLGSRTPSFEFDNVPFSEFGYTVQIHATGLNGSDKFVRIDEVEKFARADLSVSPAPPFTVVARDQFQAVVRDLSIEMWPVGAPLGRPVLTGVVDNFGTLTFDKVQRGTYQVFPGSRTLPLADPVTVQVQTSGFVFSRSAYVNHQHVMLEVPQGELVTVHVRCGGIEIAGAKIKLYRVDSRQYEEYQGDTDGLGRCKMPPLAEGRYSLSVEAAGYRRWSREFQLAKMLDELRRINVPLTMQ